MSPEQALQLLDQACQAVPASRQVHAQLVEAVKVIAQALQEKQKTVE